MLLSVNFKVNKFFQTYNSLPTIDSEKKMTFKLVYMYTYNTNISYIIS